MDVTKLLEADHRKVESLFEEISDADEDARPPLLEDLVTSLRAHMQLEEVVLYPAMEPVTGGDAAQEGVNEHELARKVMQDVVELAPGDPGFEGALETLKAAIEHHVEDEESEVFPELRKDGTEVLASIRERFMQLRTELGLPNDPAALADASTKEELLEDAKAAGVEGYSSMTKEQLAEAVLATA